MESRVHEQGEQRGIEKGIQPSRKAVVVLHRRVDVAAHAPKAEVNRAPLCFAALAALAASTLACSECPGNVLTTYTLDLSAFPGGLEAFNSTIAFPIDTSDRVKHVTELSPSELLAIYDRVGCWDGVEESLEDAAVGSHIPEGDAACVRSIDVVFDAKSPADVCYGYRSLDGEWHYDLRLIEPTRDPSGETWTAHIPVGGEPMDALEIPTGNGNIGGVLQIRFEAMPTDP